MNRRIDFFSPRTCMVIVLLMYLIKVIAKISLGRQIHSLGLMTDGIHNLSDMAEASIILYVIHLSRKGDDTNYPMGRSSLEPFAVGVVGIALLAMGLRFLVTALLGLAGEVEALRGVVEWADALTGLGTHERMDVPPGSLPIVVGILSVSFLLSCIVSRYQIGIGRRTNHPSLIADGKETFSDSLVEIAVLVSVLGTELLGWPWLDPVATLIVSFFLFNTSREMLSESLAIIQNRSLDQEVMDDLGKIIGAVNEVEGFDRTGKGRIRAFALGGGVFVNVRVFVSTTMPMEGFWQVKRALKSLIANRLADLETVLMVRPAIRKESGRNELVPLIEPSFDRGWPSGVIAERPDQADEWVLVESLSGIARRVRRLEPRGDDEDLLTYVERVRADVVVLGLAQDGADVPVEVPCERVSALTFSELFR